MMVRATYLTGHSVSRSGVVALPIRTDGSHHQNVWLFSSDRQESNQSSIPALCRCHRCALQWEWFLFPGAQVSSRQAWNIQSKIVGIKLYVSPV